MTEFERKILEIEERKAKALEEIASRLGSLDFQFQLNSNGGQTRAQRQGGQW